MLRWFLISLFYMGVKNCKPNAFWLGIWLSNHPVSVSYFSTLPCTSSVEFVCLTCQIWTETLTPRTATSLLPPGDWVMNSSSSCKQSTVSHDEYVSLLTATQTAAATGGFYFSFFLYL